MAEYLKTDYVDDELDTDINENRVFDIVDGNGTVIQSGVSFVDRTVYDQTGDDYGAQQINEQNTFINGLKTSFSQALTDLKATAIAQAVGATVSDTFAQVIAKLATVVNRGKVTQTLNTSTKSYTIPAGYHNGEGTVSITTQEKTVTGSRSAQTVTPDSGKVLSKVTVNKYPDASGNYPTSGNITTNGTHDMGATNNYRYVKVAVGPLIQQVGPAVYVASQGYSWNGAEVGRYYAILISIHQGYNQTFEPPASMSGCEVISITGVVLTYTPVATAERDRMRMYFVKATSTTLSITNVGQSASNVAWLAMRVGW